MWKDFLVVAEIVCGSMEQQLCVEVRPKQLTFKRPFEEFLLEADHLIVGLTHVGQVRDKIVSNVVHRFTEVQHLLHFKHLWCGDRSKLVPVLTFAEYDQNEY
ncbi:hypothetical protein DPMN_090868 [Dreissena polymorpha]|uniref:Uncharacterized protein n=1 Tax=Dreissena polymorpha TaxID=45954 RepID=A0A9D4L108_DREPO|nr:hypothetical protein DPMN_090868 [Dreissena polymorpha]